MLVNAIVILSILLTIVNLIDYLKKRRQLQLVENIISPLLFRNEEVIVSTLTKYLKDEIIQKIDLNELKFALVLTFLNIEGKNIREEVAKKIFEFMVGDVSESSKENSEQAREEDIKIFTGNSAEYKTNDK